MSFTLAGVLGAVGSMAGAAGGIAGGTNWLSYSASKSLNKKTLAQQSAAERELSQYLTENGPSWSVKGLREAGINPILAANGGNLGATTASLNGQIGSGSSLSIDNPVNEAMQTETYRAQLNTAKKTAENLEASAAKLRNDISVANVHSANETAKTNAELKRVQAEIDNIKQDTLNKQNTRGLTGPFAAANQVGQDAEVLTNSALDWVKKDLRKTGDNIKSLFNHLKNIASPSSNSAKDYKEGSRKLDVIRGDVEKRNRELQEYRSSPEGRKKYHDWINHHIGDPAEHW